MHRLLFLLLLSLVTVAPLGAADDDEAPVYPKPGAEIPGPFHVLNVTGARKSRYHSLVVRYRLQPVVIVFVNPPKNDLSDWLKALDEGEPLATLLKKLDDVATTNPDANLGAFAVYKTETDAGEKKEDDKIEMDYSLPLQNKLEKLAETLGVTTMVQTLADKRRWEAMKDWKLSEDPENITVVMYNRHKVVQTWNFTKDKPLTTAEATKIAAVFDKLVPAYARSAPKAQLKLKERPKDKEAGKEPIAKEPKEKEEKPKEKEEKKEDK
jgi:hypothetical protein